jgi:sugar/nucleoside kinase (ribokinase family)
MNPKGLFIGLTTVDVQYLVADFPGPNSKINAQQFQLATGGPATNAAVTFAHLGGESHLCAAVGRHTFTPFISHDLARCAVHLHDLAPESRRLPPLSSIITSQASGARAVVAYAGDLAVPTAAGLPQVDLGDFDILLLDGLQMTVAQAAAAQARQKGVPVVLDGGSWKEGTADLLPLVDIAICSADFRPPGFPAGADPGKILAFLAGSGPSCAAITRGPQPLRYFAGAEQGEMPVEQVPVVDTLGAGDIFHGAFCCAFARERDFKGALAFAAGVAARSCRFLGTRAWMASA